MKRPRPRSAQSNSTMGKRDQTRHRFFCFCTHSCLVQTCCTNGYPRHHGSRIHGQPQRNPPHPVDTRDEFTTRPPLIANKSRVILPYGVCDSFDAVVVVRLYSFLFQLPEHIVPAVCFICCVPLFWSSTQVISRNRQPERIPLLLCCWKTAVHRRSSRFLCRQRVVRSCVRRMERRSCVVLRHYCGHW